jgi:hypothetical protein
VRTVTRDTAATCLTVYAIAFSFRDHASSRALPILGDNVT